MTNIEKFKLEEERIKSGVWRLGDSMYRKCQVCNNNLIIQCDYVFRRGVRIWQCGFCQRNLKVKRREPVVYKIAIDADSVVSKSLHRQPDDLEKFYARIPTKSGIHLISKPFNMNTFKKKYPNIDVHKDNPTILFCIK